MKSSLKPGDLAITHLPWATSYRGGDVFRNPPWPEISIEENVQQAHFNGATAFQAHHDEYGIVEPGTQAWDRAAIQSAWDERGHLFTNDFHPEAIAPRLWFEPKFSNGALSNPDDSIRELAIETCKISIDIAKAFGFDYMILWLAREGKYVPGGEARGADRIVRLRNSINQLLDYDSTIRLAFEVKPEDPTLRATLATVGDGLAFISRLSDPSRAGLLIEFAHSVLAGLDPAQEMAHALEAGKLWGVHLNDQPKAAIDGDSAFGSLNPLAALEVMMTLQDYNYFNGLRYVGMDVKTPGCNSVKARHSGVKSSITNAKRLFRIASGIDREELARLTVSGDSLAANGLLLRHLHGCG